ncbi:MAG: NAD(P)-binding protein [bacterium]|nr:NAD(P)-binding protein [bacterium]
MRILIIGAGVAGLTLSALLHRRGITPVVIERADRFDHSGYMLGLYYLGSRVLHGLGVFDDFLDQSVEMRKYIIQNWRGDVIHDYDLQPLTTEYGPLQGISRPGLIDLLRKASGDIPIRMGTTVRAINQTSSQVEVEFHDGSTDRFDLVVGADGLHSDTRALVLEEQDYAYRKTGWGGWVAWVDSNLAPNDKYTEYWDAGRFIGLYPTSGRLGVFVGGPIQSLKAKGFHQYIEDLRGRNGPSISPRIQAILDAIKDEQAPFFWDFHDCHTQRWVKGRVVLLGDAAVGFLPTAGIGASMAMESAAVLNDELSRTDARFIEKALRLFEKRHRKRAESAQRTSRRLGNIMTVKSAPLVWARNQMLRWYTLKMLISGIAKIMDEPI